jgi:hypothetical protein
MKSHTWSFSNFSLRSLFVAVTICSWCIWQWTIAERRRTVVDELEQHGYVTYHNKSIETSKLDAICFGLLYTANRSEPIGENLIGSIFGWDNWQGLTVLVSPLTLSSKDYRGEDAIEALSRLPGLTTVVLWDGNPQTEKSERVIEFKRKLQNRLPHVRIKHHHQVFPVG